ncbi:putative acetyltransferase [Anatilimnocola aggregata]|uniref:Putative acetyltransferase n=1 Tax=Anatilimnocola aggregata TaxID=2528021 RepID=A0A517Y6R7_9BACT|nr:GNAT family N-acetyltransferase [Anatilimnocola aggregata]QDU25915.1 putative acetyltransferase [Anatilimnocola aggregata]
MLDAKSHGGAVRIEIVNDPAAELREAVNVELRTFNREQNPAWYAARAATENDAQPLHIFAFSPGGQVCGGLFAETQFHWLKISILAVNSALRGHGIGTRLVQQAEATALARGCRYAYLDTMEYQAPIFYQRLGYQIAGTLPDWDSHGHAKFFLTKKLASMMLV